MKCVVKGSFWLLNYLATGSLYYHSLPAVKTTTCFSPLSVTVHMSMMFFEVNPCNNITQVHSGLIYNFCNWMQAFALNLYYRNVLFNNASIGNIALFNLFVCCLLHCWQGLELEFVLPKLLWSYCSYNHKIIWILHSHHHVFFLFVLPTQHSFFISMLY